MAAPKKKAPAKKKPEVIPDEVVVEMNKEEEVITPGATTEEVLPSESSDGPLAHFTVEADGNVKQNVDLAVKPNNVDHGFAIVPEEHRLKDEDEEITTLNLVTLRQGFKYGYRDVAGVVDIQEALHEDGFYDGPIHGHADAGTRDAYYRYQNDLGQDDPQGIPTAKDLEALGFSVIVI